MFVALQSLLSTYCQIFARFTGDDFGEGVEVHVSHDPEDDTYSMDSGAVDPSPTSSEVIQADRGQ